MIIQKQEYLNNKILACLRPIVFCCDYNDLDNEIVSVNIPLSKLLVESKPKRRTMKLELFLMEILSHYPDDVVVKDFDVLFNPKYQVDVLQILISVYRKKRFNVIWPGKYENGKLYYAENGCMDYKVFEVKDYDITCVI